MGQCFKCGEIESLCRCFERVEAPPNRKVPVPRIYPDDAPEGFWQGSAINPNTLLPIEPAADFTPPFNNLGVDSRFPSRGLSLDLPESRSSGEPKSESPIRLGSRQAAQPRLLR